MAFRDIYLRNFKCFEDSGTVRLAPLTLLFGRNNSGKSSILQSLLLLRQSLAAPVYGPRLNLGGPLYSAGTYGDIVHLHNAKRKLTFKLGLPMGEVPATVSLTFVGQDPEPPRLVELKVAGTGPSVTVSRGKGHGGPFELWIGEHAAGGEKRANFSFPVNGLFPLIGDEPSRVGRPSVARDAARARARQGLHLLEAKLQALRVVGAFRRHPERRYEYQGVTVTGPDATGRDVVNALIESMVRRGRSNNKLLAAVNRWLNKVGRVELELKQVDAAGKLFEVRVRDARSRRWANYADVGFGIGQLLPVLVEGLRTPEGGIFMVQEPEIHLHPDAQLAMADFLIELMRAGRQVLIETHSEHLLLRVRRRILAGAREGLAPEQVSILYVEKSDRGASEVVSLDIDALGQAENWPAGFLQEANNERMALLEEMTRRVEEGDHA